MMRKKTCLALLLALTVMIAGCDGSTVPNGSTSGSMGTDVTLEGGTGDTVISENSASGNPAARDTSGMFSNRDFEDGYNESKSAAIQLNGDSAACSSNAVQISGSTVTITEEGTYILSGTLDSGMIIVNTDKSDKVQLVLDNADIHSETCAPIYILQSDKVFITLAAGSANALSNGGTFTAIDENGIDGVIFSKEDLTLNGSGTLMITSPAGHGIVSKDSLKITNGSYHISAASHAIAGKDDICIANADFSITSGKDGIHADNADDASLGYAYIQSGSFHISAEGDGISASSCLQIENGSFDIVTGGGSTNAAAHSSSMWGSFRDGGMYGDGQKDEFGKRDRDFQRDDGVHADGGFHKGGGANGKSSGPDVISNTAATAAVSNDSNDSTSMKGIKAGTGLIISGGEFIINSADDSVHSNGSVTVNGGNFEIASGDDAFHAGETLTVTAGTINITESYEGLEGAHINISGGNIMLAALDDGVNAAGGTDSSGSTGGRDGMFEQGMHSSGGSITISGGTLKIKASGDGIDANGSFAVTGGSIIVCGPTQGDTAILDYDGTGTISGGTFIGTGASNRMSQTFSDSAQGIISVSVGNQSAGTQIQLSDSAGNILITYMPELDFALVILSSPDLISGETYTLTAGTFSGEFTVS